jgi:hypothetical protein
VHNWYPSHLTTSFFSSFSHLSSFTYILNSLPPALYHFCRTHHNIVPRDTMSRNEKRPDLPPVSPSLSLAEITLMYRHQQSAPLWTSRIFKSSRMSYDSPKKPSITPNNVDNSKLRLRSINTKPQELFLPTIEHRSLGR